MKKPTPEMLSAGKDAFVRGSRAGHPLDVILADVWVAMELRDAVETQPPPPLGLFGGFSLRANPKLPPGVLQFHDAAGVVIGQIDFRPGNKE